MFDGLCTLAIAPGNTFDNHSMVRTSYASHLVQKEDGNVPKGNEFESARGWGGIVSRTFFAALRASCFAVLAWKNIGGDVWSFAAFFVEGNFAEVKGLVIRNKIEYSFEKHLGGSARKMLLLQTTFYTSENRGAFELSTHSLWKRASIFKFALTLVMGSKKDSVGNLQDGGQKVFSRARCVRDKGFNFCPCLQWELATSLGTSREKTINKKRLAMSKVKSAVAIIVRNEAKYIEECICYNHLIGFDRIIIGLDRCEDDTPDRVKRLQEHLSGLDVFDVNNTADKSCFCWNQQIGYNHVYKEYKDRVEWLAMFDTDEYLWNNGNRKMNELLEEIPDEVGEIRVPWLYFGHSNRVLSAPKSETRLRWFHQRQLWRPHVTVKPILRMSMLIGDWIGCHKGNTCGQTMTFDGLYGKGGTINNYDLSKATVVLCHYREGSMEDWVHRYKKRPTNHYGHELDVHCFEQGHTIEDSRMEPHADPLVNLLKKFGCVDIP